MILTQEEVEARLGSSNNLLNKLEKLLPKKIDVNKPLPMGNGKPYSIPMKVKQTSAILTRMGESVIKTGRELGMSRERARVTKVGLTLLPEEAIDAKLKIIQEIAVNKLMGTLDRITDDKLDKSTARDLSSISKNLMSIGIFDRINGLADKVVQAPQVLVYAPNVKTENNYTVIEA